ncbi:hypothetical protein ONA02_04405 [Mycoplasmopsis felis]|uniref:hypothetical protein n=1 Tax=Mycoplasmopsis felis TaxID=33923 RepID=UPI00228660AE|nr:hypothetical protein [Mycoplasmopsis felis]WAM01874.1 hypothetical protein ONA02_04405 [Mycoplasmopsis felis]
MYSEEVGKYSPFLFAIKFKPTVFETLIFVSYGEAEVTNNEVDNTKIKTTKNNIATQFLKNLLKISKRSFLGFPQH